MQIEQEWDFPFLDGWNKYSRSHPPLHIMVAAYLGIKPEQPKPAIDDGMRLINELTGALGRTI